MELMFGFDSFRLLFAGLSLGLWVLAAVCMPSFLKGQNNKGRYYLFTVLTLLATLGIFLSLTIQSLFICFEIMSFTSYVWIVQDEKKESMYAGSSYLGISVLGGMVMLMGLFILYAVTGTVMISEIYDAVKVLDYSEMRKIYVAGVCFLFGFGAKAGAFPMHVWLAKSYPSANGPAAALMSGLVSKTGIFGILILTCEMFRCDRSFGVLLVIIGLGTMGLGAIEALFTNDIKRATSYISMSLMGMTTISAGMIDYLEECNGAAVRSTVIFMINHALIMFVMFMTVAVIVKKAGSADYNSVKGFGRKKTALKASFLVASLSAMGMPLFAGFAANDLLMQTFALAKHPAFSTVFWLYLAADSVFIVSVAKLFICLFVEKNGDSESQTQFDGYDYDYKIVAVTGLLGSALLLVWGVYPGLLMDPVTDMSLVFLHSTDAATASYYSVRGLLCFLVPLLVGSAVYWFFVRKVIVKDSVYLKLLPGHLDLEKDVYRPAFLVALPFVSRIVCRAADSLVDTLVVVIRKTILKDTKLPVRPSEGTAVTYNVAKVLAYLQNFLNKTTRKKNPKETDYVHELAQHRVLFREEVKIVKRSLAFALLLFGIGFTLTMIYLIVVSV